MEKVDHSKYSWMENSRMVLTKPDKKIQNKAPDRAGLTPAERKRLDDALDRKLYPELYGEELF